MSWLHIPHKDKIAHFIFYFVFTVLWHLYMGSRDTVSFRKTILLPFFAAVTYGGFIEICQGLLTTNRSADIMDALTNTAGSAIAVLTLWLKQKDKQ
jgi:VanZ family protein